MLGWILLQGFAMSVIALVGSLTLLFSARTLERALHPLVALAAGTLLGGSFFHRLPSAAAEIGSGVELYGWLMVGFATFFLLEQILHWHHHAVRLDQGPRPLTHLVLLADGLHNLIGGIGVAGAFLIDLRVGVVTWLAAAAHEIPQELGDFAILVHGGWSRRAALLLNFLSALTFPLGSLLTWALASEVHLPQVVAFAAGNFLYIGASDLVPEVARHPSLGRNLLHFALFAAGAGLLLAIRLVAS